jgi:hypothetical protein
MAHIYKSAEGERSVRERYLRFLEHWPVPSQQLRVPTREGETFIVACGEENAPRPYCSFTARRETRPCGWARWLPGPPISACMQWI